VSDVLLITPPDKIFNQNFSILLVYPTEITKNNIQEYLSRSEEDFNIYIYDQYEQEHDIDWLLSVSKFSDVLFIDIDNCDRTIRDLSSYLVSLPRCYWLTQAEQTIYNKLSAKRVYDPESIQEIIGAKIEETE